MWSARIRLSIGSDFSITVLFIYRDSFDVRVIANLFKFCWNFKLYSNVVRKFRFRIFSKLQKSLPGSICLCFRHLYFHTTFLCRKWSTLPLPIILLIWEFRNYFSQIPPQSRFWTIAAWRIRWTRECSVGLCLHKSSVIRNDCSSGRILWIYFTKSPISGTSMEWQV